MQRISTIGASAILLAALAFGGTATARGFHQTVETTPLDYKCSTDQNGIGICKCVGVADCGRMKGAGVCDENYKTVCYDDKRCSCMWVRRQKTSIFQVAPIQPGAAVILEKK